MADLAGVSDEQLDAWEAASMDGVLGPVAAWGLAQVDSVRALVGEVRASRAREAELLAEKADWQAMARVEVSERLGQLRAERDVLQQRIDKALETIADWEHVNDPDNFWARSVRAAVTGAGDQPIEETP